MSAAPVANGTGSGALEVTCGPLLNYKGLTNPHTANPTWHGSVLIVTNPGANSISALSLKCVGQVAQAGEAPAVGQPRSFDGQKLYEDSDKAFWRFLIQLPLEEHEAKWEYSIPNLTHKSGDRDSNTKVFNVPSAKQSMRIMFHSCNGFSVGTDEDAWSGCALWNDVLRTHQTKPFHVMIGGGDQIYNDSVRVDGPLKAWTAIHNPEKRRKFPFDEKMRAECDAYYFKNYCEWYSTRPFADANGIIPQLNIWDDHDIIDGFGSYTDHFMKCSVFRGIGGVAHKYYLLFQHHVPPPKSTFTTDAPQTQHESGTDSVQTKNTYVMDETTPNPMYLFGGKPGPYVEERSMSMYTQLGARIAFLGIDARTERTRHRINYEETYDMVFDHVSKQVTASNGAIKHFILLLGVPIAYPRLQWLENILTSPLMGPIKFLNKRFGVAGGLFNQFDDSVDLMDDLDDHYTAGQHKKERRDLIHRLQNLSKKLNVRVTILGGDVHLGAFGRFYSNPDLGIPPEEDHRFMGNIISSAITNHPPPAAVANLLAKRNKIHHLDHETDETLLNLWDVDPGVKANPNVKPKTASGNHCTMPSRNYAIITESHTASDIIEQQNNGHQQRPAVAHHNRSKKGNPRDALHAGEDTCGLEHPAASNATPTGLGGAFGLDVCYKVEIDHSDREGKTDGYGLSIPGLQVPVNAPKSG